MRKESTLFILDEINYYNARAKCGKIEVWHEKASPSSDTTHICALHVFPGWSAAKPIVKNDYWLFLNSRVKVSFTFLYSGLDYKGCLNIVHARRILPVLCGWSSR